MKNLPTFEDFINESFDFKKFTKANDREAIRMLRSYYGDVVAGEDFYPGQSTEIEKANDRFEKLVKKGLLKIDDEDEFTYIIT